MERVDGDEVRAKVSTCQTETGVGSDGGGREKMNM